MTEFADENPEASAESLENGEAGTEAVTEPSGSGSGSASGTVQGVGRRLFDGSARGPSVDQIRADYGVETPYALVLRGFIRVSTGDGVPPIAEIFLGLVLAVLAQNAPEESAESDENAEKPDWEAVTEK